MLKLYFLIFLLAFLNVICCPALVNVQYIIPQSAKNKREQLRLFSLDKNSEWKSEPIQIHLLTSDKKIKFNENHNWMKDA